MPCKIQIKQNITKKIELMTSDAFNMSLVNASKVAADVNSKFKNTVVTFSKTSTGRLDRSIYVPQSLVEIYYNHELSLEKQEPSKTLFQKERAKIVATSEIASMQYLTTVGEMLSAKFGIPYKIVHSPNKQLKGFVDMSNPYSPKIVINSAKATLDTPLHEFGHLFIQSIRLENKALYSNIIKEVSSSSEGKAELEQVKKYYQDYTYEEQVEEVIVELLGKYAKNQLDPSTGIHKVIEKIWNTIVEFFERVINMQISQISPNTSLEMLAKLMTNPNIQLETNSYYNNEIKDVLTDLNQEKKNYENLISIINQTNNPVVIENDEYKVIMNQQEHDNFINKINNKISFLIQYVNSEKFKEDHEVVKQLTNDKYSYFSVYQFTSEQRNTYEDYINIIDTLYDKDLSTYKSETFEEIKETVVSKLINPVQDSYINDLLEDAFNGYTYKITRLGIKITDIPKAANIKYIDGLTSKNVSDIVEDLKVKITEIENDIKTPSPRLLKKEYRSTKVYIPSLDDNYTISGSYNGNNISVTFSSSKYSMSTANENAFWKVMPVVINTIGEMFADKNYDAISFTPMVNAEDKNKEMRLKGYNLFAKRLFGDSSIVAKNENLSVIPIPELFKNRIKENKNFYQRERTTSAVDASKKFLEALNFDIMFNAEQFLKTQAAGKIKNSNSLTSAVDVMQKFVAIASNKETIELPKQAAYVIYEMLGRKNKLSKDLWFNIEQWSGFQAIHDKYKYENLDDSVQDYMDLTPEEMGKANNELERGINPFAKKMAIVEFIHQTLITFNDLGVTPGTKRLSEDVTKEYFEKRGFRNIYERNILIRLMNQILNWLNEKVFNNERFEKYDMDKLNDLVLDIVDDVYKEDYIKFTRGFKKVGDKIITPAGEELVLKDYEESVNSDPVAMSIMNNILNNIYFNKDRSIGPKLSGSAATRKYGKTYRPVDEAFHDFDIVIPMSLHETEATYQEVLKIVNDNITALTPKLVREQLLPLIQQQTWYKNFKALYPGFKITNAFVGRDHKKGESITVTGVIDGKFKRGQHVKDTGFVVDFFVRTKESEGNVEEFDNYWKTWKGIYEAKLKMGRLKDLVDFIYFDPFIKDVFKFTNKGYRYFSFAEPAAEVIEAEQVDSLELDVNNLNLTPEVVNYLYKQSSLRLSQENFGIQAKEIISILQGSNLTNQEILEKIKCL
jgi:hypothetical protein